MLPVAIHPAIITAQVFVRRRHLQVAILPTTTVTVTPVIPPMMI
jgi:hypothetical protein